MKNNGLDDGCENALGQRLLVKTAYGWGWCGNDNAPLPPPHFHMRLQTLWLDGRTRRGGIGLIEEINHPYDGWKVFFCTRHKGLWNFTDNIGHYNIDIAQEFSERKGWPVRKKGGCSGFGMIKIEDGKV